MLIYWINLNAVNIAVLIFSYKQVLDVTKPSYNVKG